MLDEKDGGEAFPHPASPDSGRGIQNGMSVEDFFAAHALQGVLASRRNPITEVDDVSVEKIVGLAWKIAAEMIAHGPDRGPTKW